MGKPPGIRDVAKQAHVSAATVSRVINAQAGVDDQTRSVVWQTIKQLGYNVVRHPDALAGILVVAPMVSFHNRYWRLAMSGVLDEAARLSIPVKFSTALTAAEVRQQIETFSRRDGVIGVLPACFPMDLSPDWLPAHPDIVTVSILMRSPGHSVNIDMYEAFRNTVLSLAEQGHRRISLAISAVAYWAQYQRLQGFLDGCSQAGIEAPDVAHISPNEKAGQWLKQRLSDTDCPTAVIGGTSGLSNHLFATILRLQLRLPQDLSFVGAGHVLPFEKPFHDTIAQPAFDLGVEAVRTLRQAVTHPHGRVRQIKLPAQRHHAGTTGRVP